MSRYMQIDANPNIQTYDLIDHESSSSSDLIAKLKEDLVEENIIVLKNVNKGIKDFAVFTQQLCHRFHLVAARNFLKDHNSDGFTLSAPPFNFVLLAHSEGVYQPHTEPPFRGPDTAFFYCRKSPPDQSGETFLVDGAAFYERLPEELKQRFETQGIIYEALWEQDRWYHEFGIKDAAELAIYLDNLEGVSHEFVDDLLRFRYAMPAITESSSGRKVFATGILAHLPAFNHPAYHGQVVYTKETNKVYFGNGEQLDNEIIYQLVDIQDAIAIPYFWHDEDMLVFNNTRFMHGRRMSNTDCERNILTRFGYLA